MVDNKKTLSDGLAMMMILFALDSIFKKHGISTENLNKENLSFSELNISKNQLRECFSDLTRELHSDELTDEEFDSIKNISDLIRILSNKK